MATDEEIQDHIWDSLYRAIVGFLKLYGKEDACGDGDYWVVDDNYGWRRHTIDVFDLRMFDVVIVKGLRRLLQNIPNWDIVLVLDTPGVGETIPPMGVTIRRHEIIDGLQRDYLPKRFQNFKIPGSRPGTGYD